MARTKAKQPELTLEQIEKALIASNGIQARAAARLNVTRAAISLRVKRSKRLQKVIEDTREVMLDISESVLFNKIIEEKNLGAVIFYLKCMGKNRGYVERKQIESDVNLKRHEDWIKQIKDDDE